MRKHPTEWLVLALSVLALGVLVALIVYDGVTAKEDARLGVLLAEPRRVGAQWVVPLSVTNRGADAATSVDVEVDLLEGERKLETSTVTVSFAPEGSEVDAAVVFSVDPAGRQLEARVLGYELP